MILPLLALLAACAWLCRRRGHRPASAWVASTAAALLLLAACGPLPYWLLSVVQPEDRTAAGPADWPAKPAIVVIGAGVTRAPGDRRTTLPVWSAGRVMRAAQLHAECARIRAQCLIFLSGGKAGNDQVTEADLFAEQLRALGVPATDLVLERRSDNTWQNVEFTAPLLRQYGRDGNPVVLTSGIHVWRTQRYFEAFGITVEPIATDFLDAEMTVLPKALNVAIADLALHEVSGMARLHIYSALGLND